MLAFAALDVLAGAAEGSSGWTEGELYREAATKDMSVVKNLYERAYKRMKRDPDEVMEANNAFGPQYCKESRVVRRSRKRPFKKLMQKIEAASYNVISRWQSLTCGSEDPLNATDLSHKLSYYAETSGGLNTVLPVYAFNLSALPTNAHNFSGDAGFAKSVPMYRLLKDTDNKYRWFSVAGVKNDPAGVSNSKFWQIESSDAGAPQSVNQYNLDWVAIRLMLKGAEDRDSKIDIMEVKFSDMKAGPLREYNWQKYPLNENAPVDKVEDAEPTGDDINEITVFWDKYLASRTVHPFRTSYLAPKQISRMWTIIRKKTVTFPPMNAARTVPGATVGYTKCENIFQKYDYFINLRSNNPATETAVSKAIVSNQVPQPPGYVAYDRMGADAKTQNSIYGAYDRDHWLIISAHAFDKSEASESYTLYPSFDVCIRQKISGDAY